MGLADRTRKRINRRLIPFLFLLYIIAFLDRINVGFAGLEMTRELGFSNEVFGFGAGVFFVGYFLLEIPGTLLVELWSARKWISRIMISWGMVAALTGFVQYGVPGVTDAIVSLVARGFRAVAALLTPLASLGVGWAASMAASLREPVS